MKKHLILASLIAMALLTTGCGDKSPEIADETTDATVKTVQSDASQATTKDESSVEGAQDTKDTQTLESAQDQKEIQMQTLESGMQSVYFDYDKFFIRSDMTVNIEKNAEVLNANESKDYRIKIEGNCDEWGTDEYNYALGLKRADSSKKALVAQGVDAERITLVSLGEANPRCTEKTQACWAENRRADFKVLP